jgi:hypothetical protein
MIKLYGNNFLKSIKKAAGEIIPAAVRIVTDAAAIT